MKKQNIEEIKRFQYLAGLIKENEGFEAVDEVDEESPEEKEKQKKLEEIANKEELIRIIGGFSDIYNNILNLKLDGLPENLKDEAFKSLENVKDALTDKLK